MKKTLAIILMLVSVTPLTACQKVESNESSIAMTKAETPSASIESSASNASATNPTDTANVLQAEPLTKQQMLDDFDALWDTLQANYPYFGVLKRIYQERGMSANYAEECFEEYRQQIENLDENEEFSEILFAQTVEQFLMDMAGGTAHLGIVASLQIPMMADMYNTAETMVWHDVLTEKDVVEKNNVLSSQIEAFRLARDNAKEDATATDTAEPVNKTTEPANLEMKIMQDDKTAYIKINSFDSSLMEEEVPQILAFYDTIKDCENLIIDLTENSGGNVAYWMEAIVSPNIEQDTTVKHDFMMTDAAIAEKFRGEEYKNTGITVEDIKNNPRYVNLKTEDLDILSLARTDEFTVPSKNHKKLFDGRIWMLTSPNVYSASEKLVSFSKDTGFATLVGQVTGGEGIGGDPVLYPLPNSKIIIRFNVEYCLNHDGSSNQEIGTAPDILADNPLEACLAEIKKK